tara:strand:+ start:31683 stop:31985 length:303 start_codon:yes stop_codon:yes gene_type:complete
MNTLIMLCLLSAGTYQERKATVHALKVSPASFEQVAEVYKAFSSPEFPELTANLKAVAWHKFEDEKFTFYFEPDQYIYDGERERLGKLMRAEFERMIKKD